ncbi:XAC2610-related protein [Chryseobacterium limigenitum]|uniref:Uncharacterized protein n=1 Tax=Chryseobacterium limigenitum TaxID=1612149 RepID=A0A1K2IPF8_9FLAO|nr:hypothetical protein [Chryseobacterium limigenitum]SFZ94088.1 hypothetical protein SAMN05216324_10632 [Chryseobacterium limigenitum]
MKKIVFLTFLAFINCNKKTEKKVIINADSDSLRSQIIAPEKEDTATVPFSKSLTGNGYFYTLEGIKKSNETIDFKSINIFYKRELHQKIIFDTVSVLNENEAYFSIDKDANFDGYNDLEVVNQVGNYFSSSSFWLYNKKNKKYIYYKPFDSIINPGIDAKNKAIISDYYIGPSNFYSKTYEWKGGNLILQSMRIDEEGEVTEMYRKNGKLISR